MAFFDYSKLYDRSEGEKWAHPELAMMYGGVTSMEPTVRNQVLNLDATHEQRVEALKAAEQVMNEVMGGASADNPAITRREIFHAPGCPEEPEAEVEIVVYRPEGASKDEKLPVLFAAPGGGMTMCMIELDAYWSMADKYHCVIVCPRYRTAFQKRYPAAINDLHAGYQWMMEHGDELGADTNNVVLYGMSSGSHLAVSLAFRLKRYGYSPKGCVTAASFMDHRPVYATSTIKSGGNWDASNQFKSSALYLGPNEVAYASSPEQYPIYATADDCLGLCPIFIHSDAEEASSLSCDEFIKALTKAGVYHELHTWGGSCHGVFSNIAASGIDTADMPVAERDFSVFGGNIQDCWKYDLRRTWIRDLI